MYAKIALQPVPQFQTEASVPSRPASPVREALLAAAAAATLAAGGATYRAVALERTLENARAEAARTQLVLEQEAAEARVRSASLETELSAAESETERLYEVVSAMRSLGEQIRVRVGLPGPMLDPLPERITRLVRAGEAPVQLPPDTTLSSVGELRFGTDGIGDVSALPPDSGPWPAQLPVASVSPSRALAHIAATSDAISRELDVWQQLGQAVDDVLDRRTRAARPTIHPLYGPITSWFGRRPGFWGILAFHTGVDISVPVGSPVAVTADGFVTYSGIRSGYGVTVEVQHVDGLLTLYGHLSRPLVRVGQAVSQGQVIALSGNSGISTGPHLHYELRANGTAVDPTRYW